MGMRIVFVDDEEAVLVAMRRLFERFDRDGDYSLEIHQSLEAALNATPTDGTQQLVHALLLDLGLNRSLGESTIARAKELFGGVPIVVVTGGNGELEMLEAGAHAFILKTDLVGREGFLKLINAIEHAIALAHGGRRWAAARRKIHETSDRHRVALERVERIKRPLKIGGYVSIVAVAALAGWLIDHNFVKVLPDLASKGDLVDYAKRAEVKAAITAIKHVAVMAADTADAQDSMDERIQWLVDAQARLFDQISAHSKLPPAPKRFKRKHRPIEVEDEAKEEP